MTPLASQEGNTLRTCPPHQAWVDIRWTVGKKSSFYLKLTGSVSKSHHPPRIMPLIQLGLHHHHHYYHRLVDLGPHRHGDEEDSLSEEAAVDILDGN